MPPPIYNTDLIDIIANISSITGWSALGGGASGLGFGADFAMQGSNAVDKAVTASEKGQVFSSATAITIPAGYHVFVWAYLATSGLANTLINRGLSIVIGSSLTAYNSFHVEGSDTYGAVGRVGKCYPIKYVNSSNSTIPYRTLIGLPGTNPQFFGATTNIISTVKGSNLGVSAIRYGTGIYISLGDSATPGTIQGSSAVDGAIANRWSILTFLGGSSYELQGSYVIGQNSSKIPTQAYFVDSNKSINIVDTPHSETNFTKIIIDHVSTYVKLENINIEAIGSNNKGEFTVNTTSTVLLNSCNFSKIGLTTLQSGTIINDCAWRQCLKVTLNNAQINNSTFRSSIDTIAVTTSNLSLISGCEFVSSGTGYAIEITTAGTYTFTNNSFSGYGANLTTNAAIRNNSGGLVTINISGGSTPTYSNGVASTTIVNNAINLTLTSLVSGSDVVILIAGTSISRMNFDNNIGSTFTYIYENTENVDIAVYKSGYMPFLIRNYTLSSTNSSLPIKQVIDRSYV